MAQGSLFLKYAWVNASGKRPENVPNQEHDTSKDSLCTPERYHSRSIRLEGKSNTGGNQAAAEEVHGPLPSLGLGLLPRLDAPEPAGGRIEGGAAAALSSGRHGKASAGDHRLADAAQGARGGRGGVADKDHCTLCLPNRCVYGGQSRVN